MDDLLIEATKYTPHIHFQAQKHVLEIRGESYPEDAATFFRPIFDWVESYIESLENEQVLIQVEISYFNSSSSKALFDLFDYFEQCAQLGKKVRVEWIYFADDDIALEYGEDFQMDMESMQFELIERP